MKRVVAGGLTTAVLAASCVLIALSPAAKATPSGGISLFAGGLGEGPGTEIGGIVTTLSADSASILSGSNTRSIVRQLDRASGNQTVFAGSGAAGGLLTATTDLRSISLNVVDIEHHGADIYVVTFNGGSIAKIDGSNSLSIIASNVSADGVAVAPDDTIYWTENARIRRRLPNGTIEVVAGSATAGFADGPGATAQFSDLRDIEIAGNTLYVADNLNRRVRAIDVSSPTFPVTTLAGNGSEDFTGSYHTGPALGVTFRNVLGLDLLSNGDLLVGTGGDGHVRIIDIQPDPANNTSARFAGSGSSRPPTTAPGINPLTANFGRVYDVSVAPDGAVAIGGDLGMFLVEGGLVRRVAGNFTNGRGGDGASAVGPLATLLLPRGLASDAAGNVYVADGGNLSVRRIDQFHNISRVAGPAENFGVTPLGDGGQATSAWMQPSGVAVDRGGNLYITDIHHDRVRKVTPDGIVTSIAGNGTTGTAGDGGPALDAQLDQPWGIAVDSAGAVYISEIWQTRVRKISGGVITTVYDDPGTADATFNRSSTRGIAIGPDDSLYIADQIRGQIRRIPPGGGSYEVVAGTGVSNGGTSLLGEGGPATAANLSFPGSVAVDHLHNVYLNDGCSIRKVDAVTRVLTTLGGAGACGLTPMNGQTQATAARFGTPTGIAFLGTDLIFSDEGTHRVFVIDDVVPAPAPPEADVLSGKLTFHTDRYEDGNNEIVVSNPDGSGVVRLTNSPGSDTDPDFSPDGSRIVFSSNRDGNFDIYKMNSDGNGLTNLTSPSSAGDVEPVWSPDGTQIAYVANGEIMVTDIDGTLHTSATDNVAPPAAYPSWTPDGDLVFHVQEADNTFNIYRITPGPGATAVQLTTDPDDDGQPTVSPDGSKIVFLSDRAGNDDIWIMNADGTNQTRLTTNPGFDVLPAFSADGKYVLYNQDAFEMVRIRIDGSNPVTVVDHGGTVDGAADWVDNLTITASQATAVAQPATVEGAEVLLQPEAPAISASAPTLSLLNILGSPLQLSLLNILGSPLQLSLLNILGSAPTLSLLNILGSAPTLSLLNILGSAPTLSLLNILGSPGLDQALDQISVMAIPIEGGWDAFFADGRPIQGRTLLDALKTGKPIPLLNVTINETPLSRISLFSFFLGQTPLRNLANAETEERWCVELEKLDDAFVADGTNDANDCGNARFGAPNRTGGGLGATLIELQMQGIPLTLFPELAVLTFDGVNWDIDGSSGNAIDTPFEATRLFHVDLDLSDLGSLTVLDLTAAGVRDAILDCSAVGGICGSDETLAFAQNQGAIRPEARLQQLLPAIGERNALLTLIGLLPPEVRPLQALDANSAVFAAVDEPGVNDIEYTLRYSPVGVISAHEPTISVTLPQGFVPVVGSAEVLFDDYYVPRDMKIVGRTFKIRLADWNVSRSFPLELKFRARPGQLLSEGRRVSARITAPGVDQAVGNRAGVAITERFEPENNVPDTPTTPVLVPDTMYLTHVAEPGDVDYFTLPMNAGDRVRILLDQPQPDVAGTPADLDMVVYAPQAATTAPLRAAVEPNEAIVPVFDNPNRLGEPVRPDVLQDIDLLAKPVAGMSTNRGGFNEGVTVLAPVTGNYIVQVSGYNGASSSHPYSLQASMEKGQPIPACPDTPRELPVVPTTQRGTLPTTVGGAVETLVLVNPSRMYAMYDDAQVATMLSRVQSFAANSPVNGAVIGLDGNRADGTSPVRAAYAAWDADPCSVDLANDVVRKINAEVDRLVNLAAGTVKHIVVVGNDDVVPMARIPDLTQAANERTYDAARIAGGSLSTASALAAGNVLSDDPYGDAAPSPYLGRHLYVSDVGIGRLVESPVEIDGQLANYLGTFSDASSTNDGRLAKDTAFTAGYDFMTDLATEVDSRLDTLTGASATADNQRIGNGWSDLDLDAKFTNAPDPADLVSLNAHFTHNALEPPTIRDVLNPADSRLTTADVDTGAFNGGLVFSMGCHSGLNVPDIIVGAGDPATRDWAQALSAKRSTFIGQTGFGYGLKEAIALSEDIMLGFTKNITTTMSVGQALAFAKHDYLGGLGVYGVYDEKALAQATMYGLPHWKVGTAPVPGSGPSLPTTTDERTGLAVASFDHAETFTPHASSLGTYWSGLGGTQNTNDRPIQPKSELDVSQPGGLIAHGAEITGLTSDELSVNPVFATVVLDDSTRETEVEDPNAVFPAALQRINDFATPAGERQRLVLLTGQYRANGVDDNGEVTGAQRFYRRMAGRVHYSTSTDFTAPDITFTDATEVGTGVSFAAVVNDARGASTIKAVSVLYHAVGEGDAGADVWTRLSLARDPSDQSRWLGTGGAPIDGDGDDVEYLVVAVDDAGNNGYATRKGAFYAAANPLLAPPHVAADVVGQPSASGWYPSATVALTSDDPNTAFEYSLDGGTYRPYDEPIAVTGDGVHTVSYRTDDGATGEVIVPIDTAAPTVTITRPTATSYAQGAVVLADYACADAGAGIASCQGPVADGAPIDTTTPGTKSFAVTATDGAGHTTTQQVSYTVNAAGVSFDGFYSPVSNTALNKTKAGSTVPVKWRLYNASGVEIKDPASVTQIRSIPISCSTRNANGTAEVTPLKKGTVTYDAVKQQFVFNWKTKGAWVGSCRRLEITFTGGVVRTAAFQFTL